MAKRYTVDEFERFTELPENADRLFEMIGGEIVEVISRPFASSLIASVNMYLHLYNTRHKLGYITGKKGGYVVSGDCYMPDLAFISKARLPRLPYQGYVRDFPDLAVEVSSPVDTDFKRDLWTKIAHYRAAGTTVWVLQPETTRVEIYTSNRAMKMTVGDIIDGGDVLPGFTLAVKDIFPEQPKET